MHRRNLLKGTASTAAGCLVPNVGVATQQAQPSGTSLGPFSLPSLNAFQKVISWNTVSENFRGPGRL